MMTVEQARKSLLYLLLALSLGHILGAAYVGLNGGQLWRQADVYAHILGFVGVKGFAPFEDFLGQRAVYDLPLYQFLIAKASILLRADALVVTRHVNAILWLVTAYAGWRIVEPRQAQAGVVFLFLLATSPLVLHYYSVPLPDILAVALSMMALLLLLERRLDRWRFFLVCLALGTAAFVKSPVAFVFLVFYVAYVGADILSRRDLTDPRLVSHWLHLTGPLLVALACAIAAELIRNRILGQEIVRFAQDPGWYFGSWDLRTSSVLWVTMLERFHGASTRYLGYPYLVLLLLACHPVFRANRIAILSAAAAFVSGWLVFPLLYRIHDYYQLPGTLVLYMAIAMAAGSLWSFLAARVPPFTRLVSRGWRGDHLLFAGLACAAILGNVLMRGISDLQRASIFDVVEHALRYERRFLYVDKDSNFNNNVGPGVGGLAATRFEQTDHLRFEQDCERLVEDFRAVLVRGESRCLDRHRNRAIYYFKDDGYEFLLIGEPQ